MDITFQYPPDLFNLLVDTIPRLCKSKRDLLLFFRGAGISDAYLNDLIQKVNVDRKTITKAEIARTVLERINNKGEVTLKQRRELLKRVCEFEDYSSCWEEDRLAAQGLVASVSRLVNAKDIITRISIERDRERQIRIDAKKQEEEAQEKKRNELKSIKDAFYAMFSIVDPFKRARMLEDSLNKLFAYFGISIRRQFAIVSDETGKIIEQVDGAISLDGHEYLVEAKWYSKPVGKAEISEHLVRIFTRAEARAIVISASEFTQPAIETCKTALNHKIVVLCCLKELLPVFEDGVDLKALLQSKAQEAVIEKQPR